ncbi:MAG TPA: type II toxin-antitoxin system VapC family toxin [Longimicrobiales bacterium]
MPMLEERLQPIVLDTHVWIWLVDGSRSALSPEALAVLAQAGQAGLLRVSAISVWEVALLEARGRIRLSRTVAEWVRAALRAPGVELLPLTPEIAMDSTRLPGAAHGDPADRILVASARALGGRLATCDGAIVAYAGMGHVAVLDARP